MPSKKSTAENSSDSDAWKIGCLLRVAASKGDTKQVRALLAAGCHPDERYAEAATRNEIIGWKNTGSEYLEETLGEDVDRDLGDPKHSRARLGWTALHLACQHQHLDTVEILLEAGAMPDIPNRFGETPLHSVFLTFHRTESPIDETMRTRIAKRLIDAGADVNKVDLHGTAAIHLASYHPGTGDSIRCLIDAGADLNLVSKRYLVPLHMASTIGDSTVVDELLRCESLKVKRKVEGETALDRAIRKGHASVVERLKPYFGK